MNSKLQTHFSLHFYLIFAVAITTIIIAISTIYFKQILVATSQNKQQDQTKSAELTSSGLSAEQQNLDKQEKSNNSQPIDSTKLREQVYLLINSFRKENKLSNLNISPELEQSAREKTLQMLTEQNFGHQDLDGREAWYLLEKNGYYYKKAGENLASGLNEPWKIFDSWLKSPQHKAQLLDENFLEIGMFIDCSATQKSNRGQEPSCVTVLHLGVR